MIVPQPAHSPVSGSPTTGELVAQSLISALARPDLSHAERVKFQAVALRNGADFEAVKSANVAGRASSQPKSEVRP
jgi:hypothetical protein